MPDATDAQHPMERAVRELDIHKPATRPAEPLPNRIRPRDPGVPRRWFRFGDAEQVADQAGRATKHPPAARRALRHAGHSPDSRTRDICSRDNGGSA
jgi:hypothetical protein